MNWKESLAGLLLLGYLLKPCRSTFWCWFGLGVGAKEGGVGFLTHGLLGKCLLYKPMVSSVAEWAWLLLQLGAGVLGSEREKAEVGGEDEIPPVGLHLGLISCLRYSLMSRWICSVVGTPQVPTCSWRGNNKTIHWADLPAKRSALSSSQLVQLGTPTLVCGSLFCQNHSGNAQNEAALHTS